MTRVLNITVTEPFKYHILTVSAFPSFYLSGFYEMNEREVGEVVGELLYSDLGAIVFDTKFPPAMPALGCSVLCFIEVMISLLCLTSCSNLLLNTSTGLTLGSTSPPFDPFSEISFTGAGQPALGGVQGS